MTDGEIETNETNKPKENSEFTRKKIKMRQYTHE